MCVNADNGGMFGNIIWSTDEGVLDDTICGSES
jgi:hypothetical protein